MKKLITAVAVFLLALVMLAPAALADPSMTDTSGGGVMVEVYQIHRWDTSNTTATYEWVQDTDSTIRYSCGYSSDSSASCWDPYDNARYVCTFSGDRVFCQHDGASGVAMSADQRQTLANDLARGIGNRGQIPVYNYNYTPEQEPC